MWKRPDLFGFGYALTLAVSTWCFFRFLEKHASPRARQALNEWIDADAISGFDLKSAILASFDAVYTYPLFRLRAFSRSALFSLMVTAVVALGIPGLYHLTVVTWRFGLIFYTVGAIIISDYISLFVVRKWLSFMGNRPLLTLTLAPIVGAAIIFGTYLAAFNIHYALMTGHFFPLAIFVELPDVIRERPELKETVNAISEISTMIFAVFFRLMLAAVFVHLWLPLMAAGLVAARVLVLIGRGLIWSRWFLRRGRQQPFIATGLVASIIVFSLTAVWQALT